VLMIYGLCGMAAMLALLANALHNEFSGLIVIAFCAAAWVGINHLGYVEFSKAGEMFLGGKFRRIIDTETRLLDFETVVAEAPDVNVCWTRILSGSREFGFQGVRMSLDGALFEELGSSSNGVRPSWQLRIPLAGKQYINFFRRFDDDVNLLILNAFAGSVERGLKAWLTRREAAVIRMPAASELAYAASASLGVKSGSR